MARGHDDQSDADDGKILSPEELDITDDEHVAEIDDGRFVVSPNDPIGDVSHDTTPSSEPERPLPTDEDDAEDERAELTEEDVRSWMTDQFEDSNSRYGFDVTAMFDGSINQRKMVSNDVVTIFESLVLWYAQQIDSSTPVEEVLGILLVEANAPIRLPPRSLRRLLESTDLSPDDTIADLVQTVDEEDGFRL
jgi:hypothetical protein